MASRIFTPVISGKTDEVSHSPRELDLPFFKMMNRLLSAFHASRPLFVHAIYILEKVAAGDIHTSRITDQVMDALTSCGLMAKMSVGNATLTPEGQAFFTHVYAPYKHDWYTRLLTDFPSSFNDPNAAETIFSYFCHNVTENIGRPASIRHGVKSVANSTLHDVERVLQDEEDDDLGRVDGDDPDHPDVD